MKSTQQPNLRVVISSQRPASKVFPDADLGLRSRIGSMLRRIAGSGIEKLSPSYFALVMATGIVSIASNFLGMSRVAHFLFVINAGAFVVLWVLTGLRVLFYSKRMLDDLKQHAVSPGYFTMVAGTCVFGIQCIQLVDDHAFATWLWIVAIGLWALITYAVFTAIIISPRKPPLGRGLNGMWLISAVATQSISVLGTQIAVQVPAHQDTILFVSLVFFLMGCMLYLNIIAIIFFRLTFVALAPAEMTPPYWINMGATAIATQAGASLMLQSGKSQLLIELLPFLKGFTLFFWAAGTWWIPLLIILAAWTYLIQRVPVTYSPQFWGVVFPLGMYTASTYQLAKATGFDVLHAIPEVSIYLALVAWTLTFVGFLRQLGKGLLANEGA